MKVSELKTILESLDQNLDIVVRDADTGWYLNIKEIVDETGLILIVGSYEDRYEGEFK